MGKVKRMSKYETKLSTDDEKLFLKWFRNQKENGVILPEDNGGDYDFRGFWKDFVKNSKDGDNFSSETHFPDTYKKPNHETFSIESKYATGNMKKYAGSWEGNVFIPPKQAYKKRDAADILYE